MPTPPTILIVEDDRFWQSVLKEELENEGYAVTVLAGYAPARQALERHRFDLVIVDLELDRAAPLLEGERLLQRLAQRQPATPCIIVSGQGTVSIVRNAFKQYRVADFIAKDIFDIPAFVKSVREALNQSSTARAGAAPILSQLLHLLTERFSESELRTLCFHLGMDYDDLSGEGKAGKARELVAFLKRRQRIPELVAVIKQLRPDVL